MNPRTTGLLAVVLLVLGGIAFFMEQQREASKAPPSDQIFPDLVVAEVDRIEITKQNLTARLEKRSGTWIAVEEGEKPADAKAVDALLTDLGQLVSTDLVSTNAANHAVYEVDDTGIVVKLAEGGKEVAAFIVGKPGPDYNSSYVRPLEKDATYRVPVYLRTKVDRGAQSWRNKTLLDLPQDEVSAYRTTNAEGSTRFERAAEGWRSTEPFAGRVEKPEIMGMVLSSVARIVATGFADTVDAATAGLTPPERLLEIEVKDGKKHVIEIGRETAARQTYTRVQGTEDIFLVPVGRWNTVFRKAEEIAVPDAGGSGEAGGASGAGGAGAAAPAGGTDGTGSTTPPTTGGE
jgi:hypothetical protein